MVALRPLLDQYFPPCEVEGSTQPEVLSHLAARFLAPRKCLDCTMFHEGDCLRANGATGLEPRQKHRVMNLDFGPCPVKNIPNVRPFVATRFTVDKEVLIPAKCHSCKYLTKEAECARYEDAMGLPCSLDFLGIPETTMQECVIPRGMESAGQQMSD